MAKFNKQDFINKYSKQVNIRVLNEICKDIQNARDDVLNTLMKNINNNLPTTRGIYGYEVNKDRVDEEILKLMGKEI